MTKAALSTMTLWLAKELGPRGITVNAVAPGIIDTDMNAAALSDAQSRMYMESISVFGRVGQPEDVADVVGFLASDRGRWISGQSIEASGTSVRPVARRLEVAVDVELRVVESLQARHIAGTDHDGTEP